MKTKLFLSCAAALVVAASSVAQAKDAIVRTTITSGGAIEQFVPNSEIVLRSETSTAPVRYAITRETRYVDEAGTPVTVERISSGVPVNVEYVRDGDRMIVSRVVVRKGTDAGVQERTTTTTTRKLTHEEEERLEKIRKADRERNTKVRKAEREHDKKLRNALDD